MQASYSAHFVPVLHRRNVWQGTGFSINRQTWVSSVNLDSWVTLATDVQTTMMILIISQETRKEVLGEVEEAVEFALAGSELPTPELYTHVYVNQGDQNIRGCDPFTWNTTA